MAKTLGVYDELTTKELYVVDDEGRPRIVVLGELEGQAGIVITDPGGTPRAQLVMLADGSVRLLLAGSDGVTRINVYAGAPDGFAGIMITHANGRPWFHLTSDGSDRAFMATFDESGAMAWRGV